jgi:KaiC/GvpD/RAD55 family RecA-like ATPase
MERAQTGSRVLDAALDGGIPWGTSLFVTGEEGAGATEFALTLLRETALKHVHRALFASALRSAGRVKSEIAALFEEKDAGAVDVRTLGAQDPRALLDLVQDLDRGDVLAVESADSLSHGAEGAALTPLWHELADAAHARGVVLVLLHAPGTLPHAVEAALAEGADGVLNFGWRDGGPSRKRTLAVAKLRGLVKVLGGEQVPVFEVALEKGLGYTISRDTSVL